MKRIAHFSFVASLLAVSALPVRLGWGAPPQGSIPSGTSVKVRLDQKLETGETKAGESFTATVAEPVVARGRTVLAQGSRVQGRVIEAVSSGRMKGAASLTLELTQAGRSAVQSDLLLINGKSHLLRNAELIGGGAAAGAVIGGVAGGKKGAAIGAAVGAGAGTVTAYMTGKKEIVLPAELPLTFVISGGGGGTTTAARREAEQAPPNSRNVREGRRGRSEEAAEGGEGEEREERAGRREREEGEEREGRTGAIVFSARDQETIRRYFEVNTSNLPPGLAKRGGNLPPGLERQLRRNGTLPPGLQKRVEPFPVDLSRRLPRLPSGYSRVVLGNRALILDAANTILDIMDVR